MFKRVVFFLSLLGLLRGAGADVLESDFFTDLIGSVSRTAAVTDYAADGSDDADDSMAFQAAIDEMTALPCGGKITIPSGTFYLKGVLLKSNVHLVIDPGATLRFNEPGVNGTIFSYGLTDESITVSNVSIRASSGRYTVDLSEVAPNPAVKASFVNCKNVDNFLIADFNIVENYTRLSSIVLNLGEANDDYYRARNGVVENGRNLYGHYGYGMVQVQCAYNILFKDLSGTGGVTLRLETGADDVAAAPEWVNVDQIYARNISITNGHFALMLGPHTRRNGHVDADGIKSTGSLLAVAAGPGFATAAELALGYAPGCYATSCIIRNVHAVYGENTAEYKSKNWSAVPPQLRFLLSTNVFAWDSVSSEIYPGPSVGAAVNGENSFTFENVTMEGFACQPKAVLTGKPWESLEAAKDDFYKGCNQVPAAGVTISQSALSLNVTKSAMLSAAVSPEDATDPSVVWDSDNPSVAIVSGSGRVTAVGPGTATVTARTVDWGWFDSCDVTVSGGGGGCWMQLSSNDFELGWGDWVSGGTNDAFLSAINAIGTQCVNLQDNTESAFMALSTPIDLSGCSALKLEFSMVSSGFNPFHELIVEFSDDGGATWMNARTIRYDFEFDNSEREEIALVLDDASWNFTSSASLRIRCNAEWDKDDAYLDNVVVSAFTPSGWGSFVSSYNLSAVATADFDDDGVTDLVEYALGGNPTNSASTGTKPSLVFAGSLSGFSYCQLTNVNSGISYSAEWTEDLIGGSWSNLWSDVTSTSGLSGFEQIDCRVDGCRTNLFFRLRIEQP